MGGSLLATPCLPAATAAVEALPGTLPSTAAVQPPPLPLPKAAKAREEHVVAIVPAVTHPTAAEVVVCGPEATAVVELPKTFSELLYIL